MDRPDDTSGKTSVSALWCGRYGFKSRADQISHTLPRTRHRCNIEVWTLVQSRGDGHRSLVTPESVLSEYIEDLIFLSNGVRCIYCRDKNNVFCVEPKITK